MAHGTWHMESGMQHMTPGTQFMEHVEHEEKGRWLMADVTKRNTKGKDTERDEASIDYLGCEVSIGCKSSEDWQNGKKEIDATGLL